MASGKIDSSGELLGGYDPRLARGKALEHAQGVLASEVPWLRGRDLAWEVESARFQEAEDCYLVSVSCYVRGAEEAGRGRWEYHVAPTGELMPGTPRLLAKLEASPAPGPAPKTTAPSTPDTPAATAGRTPSAPTTKPCPRCGVLNSPDWAFCQKCGTWLAAAQVSATAVRTPSAPTIQAPAAAGKSWTTALVLSIVFGSLGVDRFYLGRVGSGILKLAITVVSLGLLGWIWWIIDLILILGNKLTDSKGRPLVKG